MSMLEIISINSISLDLASPANNDCSPSPPPPIASQQQQQQQTPTVQQLVQQSQGSSHALACISNNSPTGTTTSTSAISETTCELTGKMNDTKSSKMCINHHHFSLPNRCTNSSHTNNLTTICPSNNNSHNNNNNNNHNHLHHHNHHHHHHSKHITTNGNGTLHLTTNATTNGNSINTMDVSSKNSSLQPHQKSKNRKNVLGQQQLSPFTFMRMPKLFIPNSHPRNAISVSSIVSPANLKFKACQAAASNTISKGTSQVTPSIANNFTTTSTSKAATSTSTCTTTTTTTATTTTNNNKNTATNTTSNPSDNGSPRHCRRWVQCSGHEGVFAPSDKGTILKRVSSKDESFELNSYIEMSADEHARTLIPTFYSQHVLDDDEYIEMEDLLCKFQIFSKDLQVCIEPCVMDIKMGTRTFLEKEVSSPSIRSDLYDKMVKIDPRAASDEENEAKSVTKLRYMTFRESLSSTSQLGFRIEGIKPANLKDKIGKEFQRIKEPSDIERVLKIFLGDKEHLKDQMVERLKEIRVKFQQSAFFRTHEIIGSSLLIIHDYSSLGIWMIDFAKTVPLPQGVAIDHLKPWKHGNHEDGYLYGLNNLIESVESLTFS